MFIVLSDFGRDRFFFYNFFSHMTVLVFGVCVRNLAGSTSRVNTDDLHGPRVRTTITLVAVPSDNIADLYVHTLDVFRQRARANTLLFIIYIKFRNN